MAQTKYVILSNADRTETALVKEDHWLRSRRSGYFIDDDGHPLKKVLTFEASSRDEAKERDLAWLTRSMARRRKK